MSRTMKVNLFAGEGGEEYVLRHQWPADCFVQGGHKGVVMGNAKQPGYTTAYFEAFPSSFIRGEGSSLEEAEDACWEKYSRRAACPQHEYEPRGYHNGAGFCRHCNDFKSKCFTAEELGQYCETCGVPAMHDWVDDWFFCPLHVPVHSDGDLRWKLDRDRRDRMTPEEQALETESFLLDLKHFLGGDRSDSE